jgi:hypothetical protein
VGKNFFGVEEWSILYDVKFSQKQLRQAAEFPWGEDILNSTCPFCGKVVKECHFAFLGLDRINGEPLTIMKLRKLHPATGQPRFYANVWHYRDQFGEVTTIYSGNLDDLPPWYSDEKFAREATMDFRWYLLHKSIIPGSPDKNYYKQVAMLTADYEVPSAVTEATKDLLVFRKTGKFVNHLWLARCKCVALPWPRGLVTVGFFGKHGLTISSSRDLDVHYFIGLAASRKL